MQLQNLVQDENKIKNESIGSKEKQIDSQLLEKAYQIQPRHLKYRAKSRGLPIPFASPTPVRVAVPIGRISGLLLQLTHRLNGEAPKAA